MHASGGVHLPGFDERRKDVVGDGLESAQWVLALHLPRSAAERHRETGDLPRDIAGKVRHVANRPRRAEAVPFRREAERLPAKLEERFRARAAGRASAQSRCRTARSRIVCDRRLSGEVLMGFSSADLRW